MMNQAPLVGRGSELASLKRALKSAQESRGAVVIVSGEAGVGKTRLCQEIIAEAKELGMAALLGRAYEEDADIALGPVVDALRDARRSDVAGAWTALMSRARVFSAILPELGETAAAATAPMNRPLVFEILLDVVEELASRRGAVWVLEDLHWADAGTMEFIFYAARRIGTLPLVLLGTFRDEELHNDKGWMHRLVRLRREHAVTNVQVLPLDRSNSHLLIRALAGASVTADVVDEIAATSEGIPLLIEELVATRGAARNRNVLVPEVVRATVQQRVLRLDARSRNMLELAAVLGPEFGIDVLLHVRPGLTEHSLQRLVDAGLLAIDPRAASDRVRFHHALLQKAIYSNLSWSRRRQLHREIAQALTRTPALQPIERVARHWELAGDPATGLDALVSHTALLRAGGNVGRAASLGMAALQLAERHEQLITARSRLTLSVLGDLFRAGRWTDVVPMARATWTRRHADFAAQQASLANMLGLSLFYSGAVADAAGFVGRQITEMRQSEDLSGRALLLSTAAFIAGFQGHTDDAIRLSEAAMEVARSAHEPEAEHRSRNVLIVAHARRDRDRVGAALAHRRNAEFAREAGLTFAEANSWWNHAHMTAELDDYVIAEQAAEQAGTWYAAVARLMQGMLHLLEGRAQECEKLLDRVRSEIRHGIPMMATVMHASDAHLYLHQGRIDEARSALMRTPQSQIQSELPQWAAAWHGARGWLAWEEGDLQLAARSLQRAQEHCARVGYHAFELGPILLALHVDALCRLEDKLVAAKVIDQAMSEYRVPDRFLRASVVAAQFRLNPTPEGANEAAAMASEARWPWLAALVGCWRAELLGAVHGAQAARDQFAAIGAARGAERAAAVLRRLGGAPGERHAAPRSVTISRREWEVAQFVADGLTNAAIAERLFLSRPTVATHVANILSKLGFSSRAQVARWVADQCHSGIAASLESP